MNTPTRKFQRVKLFLQKVKSLITIRNIGIFIGMILFYLFLNSSIFYVSDISVVEIKNKKFIRESEIFACTKQLLGANIFSVQIDAAVNAVENCTVLVQNVQVNKILPSSLHITLEEIQPTIKFSYVEHCYLVDSKLVIKKIALESCARYDVPEILNIEQPDNPFLFTSVVKIIELSKKAGIEEPSAYESLTEGSSQFLRAKYSDHTVIFSPNIPADYYVTHYGNTISGLKGRGEAFNEIDLRFDRVIVR